MMLFPLVVASRSWILVKWRRAAEGSEWSSPSSSSSSPKVTLSSGIGITQNKPLLGAMPGSYAWICVPEPTWPSQMSNHMKAKAP